MERIAFSELTNRLHRNLIAAAGLILCIMFFKIKIGKLSAVGFELDGFTTNVLVIILMVVLGYHALAFAFRAYEEYRIWELQLTRRQETYFGGGIGISELASRMKEAADSLDKVIKNSGAIGARNQEILTAVDAEKLKNAADSADLYAKRFLNFPWITRARFWGWDIGVTLVVASISFLAGIAMLPSGQELFCTKV
jgi:hypothetical protein